MKKKTKKKLLSVIIAIIIIALLIGVFCVASYQYSTIKIDKVSAKFKAQSYEVATSGFIISTLKYTLELAGVERILEILIANKDAENDNDQEIAILYFASSKDAELALNELKDDNKSNIGMRGKTVFYGTAEAIEVYRKILF